MCENFVHVIKTPNYLVDVTTLVINAQMKETLQVSTHLNKKTSLSITIN